MLGLLSRDVGNIYQRTAWRSQFRCLDPVIPVEFSSIRARKTKERGVASLLVRLVLVF